MSMKNEVGKIADVVGQLDQQLELMRNLTDTNITSIQGLNLKIKAVLDDVHYHDLTTMDLDAMCALLEKGSSIEDPKENYNAIREVLDANLAEGATPSDEDVAEVIRKALVEVKDSLMAIHQMEYKRNEMVEEMNKLTNQYFSQTNSKEYKEKKMASLEEMEKRAEEVESDSERRAILNNIEAMRSAEDLSFLMDELLKEPVARKKKFTPKSPIDNLVEIYFDNNRSSLVMEKFRNRIPKFGYNETIYRKFFNIEENFLPEEYHQFNNLFLFHVMRTISFMDVDSKTDNMLASSILTRVYNLVYHTFPEEGQEQEFVDFIIKFCDLFKEKWSDKFEAENLTSPRHPLTVERRKANEERRRIMTIAELQAHGIEPDTTLETEDLVNQLKDIIQKKKDARAEELQEWIKEKGFNDEEPEVEIEGAEDVEPEDLPAPNPIPSFNTMEDALAFCNQIEGKYEEGDRVIIDHVIHTYTNGAFEPIPEEEPDEFDKAMIEQAAQEEADQGNTISFPVQTLAENANHRVYSEDAIRNALENASGTVLNAVETKSPAFLGEFESFFAAHVAYPNMTVGDTIVVEGKRYVFDGRELASIESIASLTDTAAPAYDVFGHKILGVFDNTTEFAKQMISRHSEAGDAFMIRPIYTDDGYLNRDAEIKVYNGENWASAEYPKVDPETFDEVIGHCIEFFDAIMTKPPCTDTAMSVSDVEQRLEQIDNSPEVAKFEEDIQDIADELHQIVVEHEEENMAEAPEHTDTLGYVSTGEVDPIVYVDRYGYYYKMTSTGMYTYYTREHTVHEENISEETVLQLMSTDSVTKKLLSDLLG